MHNTRQDDLWLIARLFYAGREIDLINVMPHEQKGAIDRFAKRGWVIKEFKPHRKACICRLTMEGKRGMKEFLDQADFMR